VAGSALVHDESVIRMAFCKTEASDHAFRISSAGRRVGFSDSDWQ